MVTALLVSHDGSRWLPAVIQGLQASTRLPDAIVAIDTGSQDGSATLVAEAFGVEPVQASRQTSYAEAVATALAAAEPAQPDEWVWLLHDDARPDPDCLQRLIQVAEAAAPEIAVVGPKLREWPSLKRLLEVGVTLSGSGRRETGLEPGEYDQGQHDEPHPVLAVNTAGMLVRRSVLEQFGFDPALPLFGTDLDFGWRLARAGHQVLVAPDAVMFHAEGAHRGRRRGELASRPHRDERVAAMHTLLANSSAAMLPLRWLRLLIGGVLRALGHLLLRQPKRAADEFGALVRVQLRPGRISAARRMRARERSDGAKPRDKDAARLLAPAWMPLRHAGDFFAELGRALVDTVRDAVHVRTGAGPESGVASQVLRSPTVWVLISVVAASLLAGRDVLWGAALHGGALLAAPDSVGAWWQTWAERWHWIGVGSDVSAPAWLLPLSLLATLLFGQASAVTWLLFVFTAPLAFWGASRFLRRVAIGRPAIYFGSAAYALLPVVSGAVGQGRVGTVAVLLLLPWTAAAALRLREPGDGGSRAIWRTALGLALMVAFVPSLWLLGVALSFAASLRRTWPLIVAPLLSCLPWLVDAVRTPAALATEAGRVSLVNHPDLLDLVAGRLGGPGQAPAWWGVGIVVGGVIALFRSDTRRRVVAAWTWGVLAAVLAAALLWLPLELPGAGDVQAAYFAPLLIVQAAAIVAATIAADGAVEVVARGNFGWRQPLAALGAVAAVGAVVAGAIWWLAAGTPGPLQRSDVVHTPVYMADLARSRPDGATLIVSGGPSDSGPSPVRYRVLRNDAARLGDDAITALTPTDPAFTHAVQRVLAGDDEAAQTLASYGIAYVHASAPVSDEVAGSFDAADGFSSASAATSDTRAWRVTPKQSLSAVEATGSVLHWLWCAIQVLALLTLVVLAAPTRRLQEVAR